MTEKEEKLNIIPDPQQDIGLQRVFHPKLAPWGMRPVGLDDMMQFAEIVVKSRLTQRSLDTKEKVFLALQLGSEVGLKPMQSIRHICVINNVPSLFGDGPLALVQASGLLEDLQETPIEEGGEIIGYRCVAKRFNRPTPVERTFTIEDAKKAGLLGKQGPWSQYQARMYQFRARGLTLRDLFPDVLGGIGIAEEVQDYNPIDVTPTGSITARLQEEPVEPAPEPEPEAPPKKKRSFDDVMAELRQKASIIAMKAEIDAEEFDQRFYYEDGMDRKAQEKHYAACKAAMAEWQALIEEDGND